MDHTHVGPIYCETPMGPDPAGFLLEPVNAITNVAALVFAVLAFLYIRKYEPNTKKLYVFPLLLTAVGIGSFLWHGLRTDWALSMDVIPGLLLFFVVLFLWPFRLFHNRYVAYAAVVLFILMEWLIITLNPFSQDSDMGFAVFAFAAATFYAIGITALTFKSKRDVGFWALAVIGTAALAAVFRMIDLYVCPFIPLGTHSLWQITLSGSVYLAVIMLIKLKVRPSI